MKLRGHKKPMFTWKPILGIAGACWFALLPARAAEAPPAVDLRTEEGQLLIASDQIRAYDWETHTLTLAPKVRERLTTRLLRTRRLASGIPFTVTVGGKPVYRGTVTSPISSRAFATPVLLVGLPAGEEGLSADQVRIQLGYPAANFFKGEDPRGDRRIRKALQATGKLSGAREAAP